MIEIYHYTESPFASVAAASIPVGRRSSASTNRVNRNISVHCGPRYHAIAWVAAPSKNPAVTAPRTDVTPPTIQDTTPVIRLRNPIFGCKFVSIATKIAVALTKLYARAVAHALNTRTFIPRTRANE